MSKGEVVLYATEDGLARFFLRTDGETVWLNQKELAELFQTSISNINIHIRNVLQESELEAGATIKENLIVRKEGSRNVQRPVKFYSLEMILAVGYRVHSPRGTQFRQWATTHLKEYFFRKPEILNLVDTAGHGTGRLDTDLLKAVQIKLPRLNEQRKIAQISMTWERAIGVIEEQISAAQNQWHALVGLLLATPVLAIDVRIRSDSNFPVSVQSGIPRILPAPKGWRQVPLRLHLNEVRRTAKLDPDQKYRLVTVKRSRGGVEARETLCGAEVKTPTQSYVQEGDFLIFKRQIVHGACGVVPSSLDGAIVSNEYAVLCSDGEVDIQFLRYLSESTYFQQTCFHSSIGIHVEKMIFKTERWLQWPFNIPPLPRQKRIVEVLDTASKEITCLRRRLEILKREKSVLMNDLLSGKRRVDSKNTGVSTSGLLVTQ